MNGGAFFLQRMTDLDIRKCSIGYLGKSSMLASSASNLIILKKVLHLWLLDQKMEMILLGLHQSELVIMI
jgi:hypothetical protein